MAEFAGIGTLCGYDLKFNKLSAADQSSKANIVNTGREEHAVIGVVFRISEDELPAVRAAEKGYDEVCLPILIKDGSTVMAKVYIATGPSTTVQPYTWYKRYCLQGALQHGLPQEYIREKIEAVPATKDPDPDRESKNLATEC